MWVKYVTRRIAVQVAQSWNFGWGEAMAKKYGLSMKNTLVFRDDKKTEYYYDKDLYEKYQLDLNNLLKNTKFLKTFHKDSQNSIETILKNTQKKFAVDLDILSNQDLLKIYKDFVLPNVEQFFISMWSVMNVGRSLADIVLKELKKYVEDNKIDTYLLSLSSPLQTNDGINERIDILNIANSNLQDLKEHTAKYRHMPMYDFDHNPYTIEHFKKELNIIKNPSKELKEIKELFSGRQQEFDNIVKDIEPDDYFRLVLTFLKENVWLRDYRDMIRQKLNLELKKFYTLIGQRLGLNVEQVATLSNSEIIEYLGKNKKFSQLEIKKRNKSFLLIQKANDVEIYSGDEALEKFKQEVPSTDLEAVKESKGIIASKGKVRGKIKVIYTNKDLNKVKQGDILVATMTRQDYLPALRLSVALITEEGSVACHAAIIARELKIPCITAVQNATQIFKDGDMVEVDANKGIIKKV